MRLADLAKEKKKLEVVYRTSNGDFSVNLEYRPQAVTLSFLSSLKEQNSIESMIYHIEALVDNWDLQDDDDNIIPVTKEAMLKHQFPIYLLNTIIKAITDDRMLFSAESKNG